MELVVLGSSADKPVLKQGKNRRLRSAIALCSHNRTILVDCGPDIQEELEREKLKPNYLFITHAHPDHIEGLPYVVKKFSPQIILPKEVWQDLERKRIVRQLSLAPKILKQKSLRLAGFREKFLLVKIKHSRRVSTFALVVKRSKRVVLFYAPDLKNLTEESKRYFLKAEILVLDGSILDRPLNVHASVKEQLLWARKAKAKKIFFTHLGKNSVRFSHCELEQRLQEIDKRTKVCFDGMRLTI